MTPPSALFPALAARGAQRARPALAALLLASLGSLGACGRHVAAAPAEPVRSVSASTQRLAATAGSGYVELPGTVVARNTVQVASRLSGFIRSMHVHEGQRVRAGQALFEVDAPELGAQSGQAQAQLAQARAQFEQAQADVQRFGDLYRDEAIPRQQWEQVQLRERVAREQLAAARSAAGAAAAQWNYASVRSPVDGVVARKLADAGDLASPGRPVLVIEGAGALQVQLQLPQSLFERVHEGDAVQVRAGSRLLPARLVQLVPVADPVARTHSAKLDLGADSGLASGEYVQALFAGPQQPQLRVPRQAVVERAGMTGVFVVDTGGVAHFRLVRLGGEPGGGQGAEVDVQAGLHGGERVVTDHLDEVENGVRIVAASGGGRG